MAKKNKSIFEKQTITSWLCNVNEDFFACPVSELITKLQNLFVDNPWTTLYFTFEDIDEYSCHADYSLWGTRLETDKELQARKESYLEHIEKKKILDKKKRAERVTTDLNTLEYLAKKYKKTIIDK